MRASGSETMTNGALQTGMPVEAFCGWLKLISNPNRLRILLHLRTGECAVGELESALELKQPNLSHELRKLRDHGLVTTRRQSKVIFYSLSGASIMRFVDGLMELRGKLHESMLETTPIGKDNRPADVGIGRENLSQENGECGQFAIVHHLNSTI